MCSWYMFYAPIDLDPVVTVRQLCGFARFIRCGCSDNFQLILQSLSFTITVYSVFIASRGQKLHNLCTLGERDGLSCIQQLGTSVVEVADLDNHTKQADGRCLSNVFFSFSALFCCWSRKILLTFLRSLFLVRRYFTIMYFRIVLRIVPGIMGLRMQYCVVITQFLSIVLSGCALKLTFCVIILFHWSACSLCSTELLCPVRTTNLLCPQLEAYAWYIIRMLHVKVLDVRQWPFKNFLR